MMRLLRADSFDRIQNPKGCRSAGMPPDGSAPKELQVKLTEHPQYIKAVLAAQSIQFAFTKAKKLSLKREFLAAMSAALRECRG